MTADMRSTPARSAGPQRPHTRPRAARLAGWVMQLGLAVVFLGAGATKLAGDAAMVDMFADIGAGQWLRYVVGALEVSGAVGVLVPRLAGWAALGLAALMVGATVTNLAVLQASVVLPLGLLAVATVLAWIRRPGLRSTA